VPPYFDTGDYMKEIKLTRGYVAKVDDEDYRWLMEYKWHASSGRHIIAKTTISKVFDGYSWTRAVSMHRTIMGATQDQIVDHINGNPLDNRKSNLRFVTSSQNARNSRGPKTIRGKSPTSRFKGVSKKVVKYKGEPRYISWNAQICFDNEKHHIGNFDSEVAAACHYDYAAQNYFGEYARLNFDGAAYDKWYNDKHGATECVPD